MAQGYDQAKAEEVNRLIAQGQTPRDALFQAGITQEEFPNYQYDPLTSQLGQRVGPPSNEQPLSPAADPSQFPAYDDDGNLQPGFAINDETGQTFYRGFPSQDSRDSPVNPAIDPSQFPAYDDDGNLQPGFAINDETGQTYYQGFGTTTNQAFQANQDAFINGLDLPPGIALPPDFAAANVNDPYYGLSASQLQALGGADPTDPYIRARLGIPQLPGSTLLATPGFGTIQTGVPLIDTALGIVGNIASGIGSVFSNFVSAVGGLFGAKPTASATAATTGSGFAALAVPTPTPPKTDTPVSPTLDPSQFPAYDDDGNLQPGFAINEENGQPYYRGFPSQDATNTPVNPAADPSQFPAYDDDGNLQPGFAINEENGQPYYQGFERNVDQPLSVTADPSQFPAYDDDGNLQPGFAINEETGDTYYQGFERNTDQPLSVTADPSQFPAYDDDGNLQPGFAINEETGDTYYQGFERNTDEPFNYEEDPFEQSRFEAELAYESQEPFEFSAAELNDPYYGLSASQLEALGGADPTDPYIRARLGIPQLPGSTLLATPGFGTINTGIPIIDSALGIVGNIASGIGAVFSNFAATVGGLFGAKPTASTEAATTGSGVNGLDLPDEAINGLDLPVDPASDPSQFPAYDDDGNLQPGWAINEETGEPYYQGFEKNTDEAVAPESDPSQFPAYDDEGNLQPGFAINEETGEPYFQGFEKNTDEAVDAEEDPELPQDEELTPVDVEVPDDVDPESDTAFAAAEEPLTPAEVEVPEDVDPEEDPELPQDAELTPVDVEVPDEVDPEEDPELPQDAELTPVDVEVPDDVDPANDPLLTPDGEEEGGEAADTGLQEPEDVDAGNDPLLTPDGEEEGGEAADTGLQEPEDVDAATDDGLRTPDGEEEGGEAAETGLQEPEDVDADTDEGLPQEDQEETPSDEQDEDAENADAQNAALLRAQEQATLQSRYKQPGVTDWRVRLVLGENSDYLYTADDADILKPLAASNGVIFPYTPNITTAYTASYETYNLIHSNYRGLFYKSSNVGDVQIRGTFTAQDTHEASYLLAVIHFFRSVTKMFYGKDAQRGTPPPLVYLVGYGDYQFAGHPCVVSQFNYNLPNEVDYIRASSPNNYGTNLLNRRTPVAASPGGINYSGAIRLANALLPKGALPQVPSPGAVPQAVANTNRSSYVPTKMEIDITLIPVQTREQVSKQFSLKAFANGNLIKGGYW